MSVVRDISDCEINPTVEAEARNQPSKNPPKTLKVFIKPLLHPNSSLLERTLFNGNF
jgi:hypothetical protein